MTRRKFALVNGARVAVPRTYDADRTCTTCPTKLSIYNPTDTCDPCKKKRKSDEGLGE